MDLEIDSYGYPTIALVFNDNGSGGYGSFLGAWQTAALAREYLKKHVELRIQMKEDQVSIDAIKYHIRVVRISDSNKLI